MGQIIMDKIEKTLLELGIPANLKGFAYIHRALELLLGDEKRYGGLHHRLYRQIMVDFNVSESAVYAGMRHAVTAAFDNMPPAIQEKYFGNSIAYQKGAATIKQFLYTLTRRLRHDDEGR